MKKKIGERAVHALISMMLSIGLVIPVLSILDRSLPSLQILLLSASVIIIFELISLHRVAVFSACGALFAGILFWVFGAGGNRIMSDFMIALTLRVRGIETAIPLIEGYAGIIVTIVLTILSCFACLRRATSLPSLILCIGAIALIWLTDRTDLIPWLLSALAATLVMLMISRSEDTPPIRIIPWAAGITAAAFLAAGAGTAAQPLKDKADELRQSVMDRMFFTEARDVFSLYSAGYSPQGPDQLGGKPSPDKDPVMQVSTPKITYLRGSVYDQYTGRAWKNTAGGRRLLWQSARLESERAVLFDQGLPPEDIQSELNTTETISIRLLKDSASTVFVPQRIREITPGGDMVPYFSHSTEVFITRNLQAGDTYTVPAPLYNSGDPGIGALLDACGRRDDPQWDKLPSIYMQLPGHLEKPLYDLADEITAGAQTPYEKAMSIQNWLNRHYRYSLDVGEHPENIDFVTSFLLDTRKGYCTYFASAMTVLCRMAGLPARYVEGYIAVPNDLGEALVTGKDAHAWTEIYFKGFGWLTFDATPRQTSRNAPEENGQNPGTSEPTPTPAPENEPDPTPTPPPEGDDQPTPTPQEEEPTPPEDEPEPTVPPENEPEPTTPPDNPDETETPPDNDSVGNPASFPWWILIPILLLLMLAIRIITTSPGVRSRYAKTEEKKLEEWIQEISDLLASERLTRKRGETPMGFTRRVDRTGYFSTSLSPVGECLSLIRYSRAEALETDTGMIRDTAIMLRSEISRPARARYWIRRIFRSRRKHDWKES